MARQSSGFLEGLTHRAALRQWKAAAAAACDMPLSELKQQRNRARALRQQLDEVLHEAEHRLALPSIGADTVPVPHDADWSWRPPLWHGPLGRLGAASVESGYQLGEGVTLFHDCRATELTLRQIRNTREADLAPFGLRMDVFQFDGSYLSLALDLPKDAAQGLTRNHLIRMETVVEMERPIEIFARLNVKHGPNTEQMVRELPLNGDQPMVEFDLAYSKLNEKRVEKLWLDLIFEGPQMNQVTLRDLSFSRRPRAEL